MASRIIRGDCREVLATLPDNSVHVCVTSPPYWSLRSYLPDDHPDKAREIGLERTLQEYVQDLALVFGQVRRVLHPLGSLWLNLGDCYAKKSGMQRSSPHRDNKGGLSNTKGGTRGQQKFSRNSVATASVFRDFGNLKPKDLCGIPWRVAFALQDHGWWLRRDVTWWKPDTHPESCKDRPTTAHEYVFLLTKSAECFYDWWAVREVGIDGMRLRRSVWCMNTAQWPGAHTAVMPLDLATICVQASTSERGCCPACFSPYARIVEDDKHVGWEPLCSCPERREPARCVVLDPFGGTGTTAEAATRLGHDSIVVELNPDTVEQAQERNRQGGLGL